MPNTLGAYNPLFFAQEGLFYLKNRLGMAGKVYLGYDRERGTVNKGDTVRIRRPAKLVVNDAPGAAQDLATEYVDLVLTKHREVKFGVTDKELAFTGPNTLDNPLIRDHIAPAAYELANDIEAYIQTFAQVVSHSVVRATVAAPPVLQTDATVADILKVWRKLFDLKAPVQDEPNMNFMLGGQEYATLAGLPAFSQWQGAGQLGVTTQQTTQLGMRYGFNFYPAQSRKQNTYADITDVAGTTGAIGAKGATTLNVTGLGAAEVYNRGTIIKFTSGPELGNQYAITGNATMTTGANPAVGISPALRVGCGSGDTFAIADVVATNDQDLAASGTLQDNAVLNQNLAFHRNWFALAMGKLPDFAEVPGQLGMNIASVQDEQTGLAMRAAMYAVPDSSKVNIRLDVLYGGIEINPDLAVRYEVKAA